MLAQLKKLAHYERLIPTLAAVSIVLFASWMGDSAGGYFASQWALVVLVLAVLMLVTSLTGLLGGTRYRWSQLAIVLLALYAGWTFLSLLWSPNVGDAWLGAGQTLLYLLAFWIVVGLIGLDASRRWVMLASSLGTAAIAAFTLPALSGRTAAMFEDGRLEGTIGYYNGEAAFLLGSFWISIYLVSSRLVHPLLRCLVLAGAVMCVELAVLTQSRGAMVALVLSLPVYFLLSGQRLRGLIAVAPVVAALLLVFPDLNSVYTGFLDGGTPSDAIARATQRIAATVAGVGAYGLIWGLVDRRWSPPANVARAAGAFALVAVVAVVVTGAVIAYERVGNPIEWGAARWEAFATNDRTGQEQSRFLSSSGTGRYVYWQVAWEDFTSNPVLGVGTHNYEATYYQERARPAGYVRQPHILPLEVLAERGVVGGVLFAGFLSTCILAGLWKRAKSLNAEGSAQVGAMIAAVAYWFVHSSAEWFWQLPAISLPVMVFLAMLVSPWDRQHEHVSPPPWSARALGAAVAVAAIASVAPLYIVDRNLEYSRSTSNPWDALMAVERAQRINPVDPRLAQREAELALQVGNWPRAEDALVEATRLNPEHYAPYQVLAHFYERMGEADRALSTYREAAARNPLDTTVAQSLKRLEEEPAAGAQGPDPAGDRD